jgi:hypothetical protein
MGFGLGASQGGEARPQRERGSQNRACAAPGSGVRDHGRHAPVYHAAASKFLGDTNNIFV